VLSPVPSSTALRRARSAASELVRAPIDSSSSRSPIAKSARVAFGVAAPRTAAIASPVSFAELAALAISAASSGEPAIFAASSRVA
jgi:hypothetical protein